MKLEREEQYYKLKEAREMAAYLRATKKYSRVTLRRRRVCFDLVGANSVYTVKAFAKDRAEPDPVGRLRAARCLIDSLPGKRGESAAMSAFLAILHPNYPEEKARQLIADAGKSK